MIMRQKKVIVWDMELTDEQRTLLLHIVMTTNREQVKADLGCDDEEIDNLIATLTTEEKKVYGKKKEE